MDGAGDNSSIWDSLGNAANIYLTGIAQAKVNQANAPLASQPAPSILAPGGAGLLSGGNGVIFVGVVLLVVVGAVLLRKRG